MLNVLPGNTRNLVFHRWREQSPLSPFSFAWGSRRYPRGLQLDKQKPTVTPRVSIFSQGKADSFTVPRPFSPRNRGIKRYCVRIYIYMYILCTCASSGRRFSLLLDNNPRLRNVVIEEREARTGRKRTGGEILLLSLPKNCRCATTRGRGGGRGMKLYQMR